MMKLVHSGFLLLLCSVGANVAEPVLESSQHENTTAFTSTEHQSSISVSRDLVITPTSTAIQEIFTSSPTSTITATSTILTLALTSTKVEHSAENNTTNTTVLGELATQSDGAADTITTATTSTVAFIYNVSSITKSTDTPPATFDTSSSVRLPTASSAMEVSDSTVDGTYINGSSTSNEVPLDASETFDSLLIALAVIGAVVALALLLWAMVMYKHRDRFCKKQPRKHDAEYVDCDNELYSNVNVYTNYRHHGARADCEQVNQEQKLMTKMETEDECPADNTLTLADPVDSGRYVSPEGLVYVTVDYESGQHNQKTTPKNKKREKKLQYASLDLDKTGKLVIVEDSTKPKKEKKMKKKNKYEITDININK